MSFQKGHKPWNKKGDHDSHEVKELVENPVMEPQVTSASQLPDAQASKAATESPSSLEDQTIMAMALNEAARLLLEQMPEKAPAVIRETAEQQGHPLWIHLVGLLQRVYDNGEHTAPVIDSTWLRTNPVARRDHGEALCQCGCGETFARRWPGQLYKDNLHGARANRTAINAGNRADTLVRHQLGQEPKDAARSGIFHEEAHGTAGSYDPTDGPPTGN